MSFPAILILGFLSGSLTKLTDDIADRNLNIPRFFTIPCGIAYGLSMGYLMITDVDASLLFGGIVLGCLITGKINSTGHYFGLASILIVYFLYGAALSSLVLLITVLAALDELKDMVRVPGFFNVVFEYRLILKLGILALVILDMLGLNALITLIAFDSAYILTGRINSRVSHEI